MSPSALTESAPAGSHAFRNRFEITSPHRLNFDSPSHVLSPADGNERIVLTSTNASVPIKNGTSLILWGSPYVSFDAAADAGSKWRRICISIFARMAIACDFGEDDDAGLIPIRNTSLHEIGMFNFGPNDTVYRDQKRLFVIPLKPDPQFIMFSATAHGMPGLNELPNMIEAAQTRCEDDWSHELRLAYQLLHLALSNRDPDVRWILAVAAVEALIPYQNKHPELTRILDALIPLVDKKLRCRFDQDTREGLKQILNDNKKKSISSYGRELAGRLSGKYDGKRPKYFFTKSYGIRSGLAHANPRNSLELQDDYLNQKFVELLRFVVDILESWTDNPGYPAGNDEEPADSTGS